MNGLTGDGAGAPWSAPSSGMPEHPIQIAFDRIREFWPSFETRDAQLRMSTQIFETLRHGGRLAVEAPTGVGKSMAYLVPALILARDLGFRVVVSTHTKNLQQQIVTRDAPRVRDVLAPGMRLALLKGRSNYICRRRWDRHLQRELIPDARADFLERVGEWVESTETGDLEEFGARSAQEWAWLSAIAAPTDQETGLLCARTPRCFLRETRRRAAASQVVVVNHALLLSHHLTAAQVLPEYEVLVVDESHTLPGVAARALERRASPSKLRSALNRLGGRADFGLWERVHGLLSAHGSAGADAGATALTTLLEPLATTRRVGDSFFRDCGQILGGTTRRFDRRQAEGVFFPPSLDVLIETYRRLLAQMSTVSGALAQISPSTEDEEEAILDFGAAALEAASFLDTLRFTVEMPDEDYVYWYEPSPEPALVALPLDPGADLSEKVFGQHDRLILTSATLTSDGDFGHYLRKSGLVPEEVETLVTDSPFALSEQVLVLAPPVPAPTAPGFAGALAGAVERLVERVERKALVLFTSHALLRDVHRRLRETLPLDEITLLGQGVDGQRESVTRDFRRASRAVLLGTASFWEGVDFPGDELELLVVTRLPFPVPTDPVVEARCEALEQQGRGAFSRYMVPEAVLRFRQGFGRLIRRRTDRGVFVILDSRVRTASYGSRFTRSIPVPVTPTESLDDAVEQALRWFDPPGGPEGDRRDDG